METRLPGRFAARAIGAAAPGSHVIDWKTGATTGAAHIIAASGRFDIPVAQVRIHHDWFVVGRIGLSAVTFAS